MMAAIRSKDTRPEMIVRRLLHGMGYRYRLHRKDLPGKPDIVFAKRKKLIFVHGCFWHLHESCGTAHMPRSNTEYWTPKLTRNKARDEKNLAQLEATGWKCLVLWECELRDTGLAAKLKRFVGK